MNAPEPSRTIIGIRTAMVLYALLLVAAFATLKGTALYTALIIVLGTAAKTYLHHVRRRLE
jgi:archaellin